MTIVALSSGCTTAWQEQGTFFRGVPTPLSVDSTPPAAKVYLDNKYLGVTPLAISVECEEETKKKTRKVSYWITQPGFALLLSIVSLGLYVPFSAIPVDSETSVEGTGVFKDSPRALRIEADGHKAWTGSVACGTQPPTPVRVLLEKS